MSKEQIEEMAKILTEAAHMACEDVPFAPPNDYSRCNIKNVECRRCKEARALIAAGYRKQSEQRDSSPCMEEERYAIAKIMAENFHINGERWDESDFEWTAHCLIEEGYRKQEWISVSERLPEIEGTYLAYTLRRTIEIAHFYPYYVNDKPQFDYWITHWMPLPEAPRKEDEKNG